jgi:uncharacterized LabA/DUF88 family protein
MKNNICILWDIENVIPSKNSNFVDGLLDFARKRGNLSIAMAVGNWAENSIRHIALNLSEKGFELFHMPQSNIADKKKKNSSDFLIIAKATEMIFQYPHIGTYILLSGDLDYRPLLQTLKKHGKKIIVVCNASTVSENLLEFADEYTDFRALNSDDDTDIQDNSEILNKKEAFSLLQEAVELMLKQKKIPTTGSVKVRMQLLNEEFTGKIEGYSSWKKFIKDAAKEKIINIDTGLNTTYLSMPIESSKKSNLPHLITSLMDSLKKLSNKKEWIHFPRVNNHMREDGVELKKPYSKFKTLVLDAEKRNLVETKSKGLNWYVKRI